MFLMNNFVSFFKFSVSNVYDGEFKISNHAWNDLLLDSNSEMFKDMAGKIEVGLDELFVNSALRDEAIFNIRVTSFSPGSVIVKFR